MHRDPFDPQKSRGRQKARPHHSDPNAAHIPTLMLECAMSKFQLTLHAKVAIESRAIRHEWIASTIAAPEVSQPDGADSELVHALARIPEFENRVLRVVYNPGLNNHLLKPVGLNYGLKVRIRVA